MIRYYSYSPTASAHSHSPASKKLRTAHILVAAGFAVLLAGVGISLWQWHENRLAYSYAAQQVNNANHGVRNGVPSTTKLSPSAFASYNTAPALPRYLFIPKLSVQAITRPLGLLKGDQLAAPTNVFDTGWYTGSSKPGEAGAMLIDGHVSSWTTNGVFYGLKTLKPGDAVKVEKGDGTIITYTVVKSVVYGAGNVDMSTALSPVDPKKPGLNLMTCTGDVIKGTSEFNERLVVFAEESS